ncbi:MAG TPA: hypothetical protein VGM28_02500 [Candidatus Limnocylindrales bacterium]|jgi:hypothetical protein
MHLSEYAAAPRDETAVAPKVLAVVIPALVALGAGEDPHGWLAWGDDPAIRWMFLAPTRAGLVTCNVRVNVAGEGPRASAKLARWGRVQVGELSIESAAGGMRVASFQVESLVLRGTGPDAESVAAFAIDVFTAIDGTAASG